MALHAQDFIFLSSIMLRNPWSGVTGDAAGIRRLACCIREKSARGDASEHDIRYLRQGTSTLVKLIPRIFR